MSEDAKAYYKRLLQRDRTKQLEDGANMLVEGLAIYATACTSSKLDGDEFLTLLEGKFMELLPVARRNTNLLPRERISALFRVLFINKADE